MFYSDPAKYMEHQLTHDEIRNKQEQMQDKLDRLRNG